MFLKKQFDILRDSRGEMASPDDTSDSLESSSSSVGVDTCGGGKVTSSDTSTNNTKVSGTSEELVVTIEAVRDNYTRRDAEDVWRTLKIPCIGLPLRDIMSHSVAYYM